MRYLPQIRVSFCLPFSFQKSNVIMGAINSACNPIFYVVFMPSFRRAMMATFLPCVATKPPDAQDRPTASSSVTTLSSGRIWWLGVPRCPVTDLGRPRPDVPCLTSSQKQDQKKKSFKFLKKKNSLLPAPGWKKDDDFVVFFRKMISVCVFLAKLKIFVSASWTKLYVPAWVVMPESNPPMTLN